MQGSEFTDPWRSRDSEDSAPAEYPPDQPEADALDDDGAAYGAEEVELEVALVKELEETEAQDEQPGEDMDMGGVDNPAGPANEDIKEEDEASDAGSEDLEAESSGSDEEELEEDDNGEGDEDVEMGDDADQKTGPSGSNQPGAQDKQQQAEPMVQ